MIETELQTYIHEHIPISIALGIEVKEATLDKVIVSAPLLPNINHKNTAFGGSLHAVATLSCWSLVFVNLQQYSEPTEIVIAKSEVDYLAPVNSDFTAECILNDRQEWIRFEAALRKKGKGRIKLNAKICQASKLAVDYHGEFVAIAKK